MDKSTADTMPKTKGARRLFFLPIMLFLGMIMFAMTMAGLFKKRQKGGAENA